MARRGQGSDRGLVVVHQLHYKQASILTTTSDLPAEDVVVEAHSLNGAVAHRYLLDLPIHKKTKADEYEVELIIIFTKNRPPDADSAVVV